MFCFFSTSQLRVLKLATNTNEWRFAVLQWGRQAASLQACRSGFWGMGRLSKDNTIKFTWWFLPFCQYPFSPLSPAVLYERHAAGPWLLATSPRAAGCCMHPGLHILFGAPLPLGRVGPSDLTTLPVSVLSPFPFMPKSMIPCLRPQAGSCQNPHHSESFQLLASALPALILLFSP